MERRIIIRRLSRD